MGWGVQYWGQWVHLHHETKWGGESKVGVAGVWGQGQAPSCFSILRRHFITPPFLTPSPSSVPASPQAWMSSSGHYPPFPLTLTLCPPHPRPTPGPASSRNWLPHRGLAAPPPPRP